MTIFKHRVGKTKLKQKLKTYSFADQRNKMSRRVRGGAVIIVVLAVYLLLFNFFFQAFVMQSASMEPDIMRGDRLIVYSFQSNRLFSFLLPKTLPLKRGDLVMIDTGKTSENIGHVMVKNLSAFFTGGKELALPNDDLPVLNGPFLKRLIALPGDEISMQNYILRIKPAGDTHTLTEFELSDIHYNLDIPQSPSLWDQSLPFAGSFAPFTLGEGEYFVLADDRSNTNDSRTWGPLRGEDMSGKVLFRYWPFSRNEL
jgi:signal peptidase I